MDFKRDVWKELLYWKNNYNETLMVSGARQVGKTYILKKFCQENFEKFIYINMAEFTGEVFLEAMNEVKSAVRDTSVLETRKFILQSLVQFCSDFVDSENTVVVFDEIQESSKVFNLIRTFTREFATRFVVTGSYLGRLLNKDFFLPAGDLIYLDMYSLTFPEFLGVFGLRDNYVECYVNRKISSELKQWFELYTTIGGYPSVVLRFIETGNVDACLSEIHRILNLYVSESSSYFDDILDVDVFDLLLPRICQLSVIEKKGKNLIEDLNKIVKRPGDSRVKKETIDRAIGWLHKSSMIGYAEKYVDGNTLIFTPKARYYFQDLGLAYYLCLSAKINLKAIHGYLAETYVYHTLRNKYYKDTVSIEKSCFRVFGKYPAFATYSKIDGEIDFALFGPLEGYRNGIEVKWGDGSAVTGSAMLRDAIIDNLYLLMGNCGFSEEGAVKKIPLYYADLIEYPLLKEEMPSYGNLLKRIDVFK